jgi:hypothetical protein
MYNKDWFRPISRLFLTLLREVPNTHGQLPPSPSPALWVSKLKSVFISLHTRESDIVFCTFGLITGKFRPLTFLMFWNLFYPGKIP